MIQIVINSIVMESVLNVHSDFTLILKEIVEKFQMIVLTLEFNKKYVFNVILDML